MTARWITADVFDGLATLDDGSVDLVVTSPPFLALRSYLPADHPDKSKEIGSEATPAEFIDTMLVVTAELRRVLAPHGSICFELGDTYAGSGGAGGDYNEDGLRDGQQRFSGSAVKRAANGVGDDYRPSRAGRDTDWPLAKSRTLIPQLYETALAYGINPLTGRPSPAGQWRIRNVVTWARPNPPVGALGDKWRPATSDVVVACTSSKRYWDDLATRKAWVKPDGQVGKTRAAAGVGPGRSQADADRWVQGLAVTKDTHGGAPLLDYWVIPPGGYQGSHYAVFPPELVVPLVKAMCPEKVCRTCGEPSRRIVGSSAHMHRQPEFAAHLRERRLALGLTMKAVNDWFSGNSNWCGHWEDTTSQPLLPTHEQWALLQSKLNLDLRFAEIMTPRSLVEYEANGKRLDENERRTDYGRGGSPDEWGDSRIKATRHVPDTWTDCGHDDYRPGIVLDPFAGSGTTLAVATGHGHDAVGIDLDPRNEDLARERIGPFFFEVVA